MNDKTVCVIKHNKWANIVFEAGVILELIVMMTDHFASWTLPYRGRVI